MEYMFNNMSNSIMYGMREAKDTAPNLNSSKWTERIIVLDLSVSLCVTTQTPRTKMMSRRWLSYIMTSLINQSADWPLIIMKQPERFPKSPELPKLTLNEPAKCKIKEWRTCQWLDWFINMNIWTAFWNFQRTCNPQIQFRISCIQTDKTVKKCTAMRERNSCDLR